MESPSVSPGLRRLLVFLPLSMLLPGLWLASSGEVAVKPVLWVAVTAVAVVAAWIGLAPERVRRFDPLLAALLGVAATHRLFFPGFPQGHDVITHLWGTYSFYQEILAGNLLPRWMHHLGIGMPFLLFYPPVAFYLMLPFLGLDLPVYDAFKYGFVLSSALSAISMYVVVRRWTSSRSAALVAAGAYCFAPYHLTESNYRVAVAEAAAMIVLPLFFYAMHQALEAPSRQHVRRAALWTAVLAMTHPLSLSMAGTGMGLWLLARHGFTPGRPLARALGLLAALGLLGVALAGYYTLPVAAEGSYVTIGSAVGGGKNGPMYARHGLRPDQLLERRAWTKWQKSENWGDPDEKNEMPFYFGLTLLALLPLAGSSTRPELTRGLLAMTLGALALALHPLAVLLARFPPMTMLQFSWRFMAIATFGACALAGFAVLRLEAAAPGSLARRAIPGLVFAVLVLDFYPYQGASQWHRPYDGVLGIPARRLEANALPLRVDYLDYPPAASSIDLSTVRRVYPEYFTPEARKAFQRAKDDAALEEVSVGLSFKDNRRRPAELHPKPYAELVPEDGGAAEGLEFSRGGGEIRVTLPGRAGRLVVKEQWFPGWEGRLGATRIPVERTDDGLMQIQLEAVDAGELMLHFSWTRWDRLGGVLLSAAVALGLWGPVQWRFKGRKSA